MAEATIGGLGNVIDLMRQENNNRNQALQRSQEGTEKNTSDLNKTMREILAEIKQDRLQNEEDRRDKKKEKAPIFKAPEIKLDKSFSGILLGLGAVIGETVRRIKDMVQRFFGAVKLAFSRLFSVAGITNLTKGLQRSITNFYKAFRGGFFKALDGSLRYNLREANGKFKKMNFAERMVSNIGKIFGFIARPFNAIIKWWNASKLGSFTNSIVQKVFGFFGKIFGFLGDTLKATIGVGDDLFKAGGNKIMSLVKGVFTKLLWPIQIIISLFDFFTGFLGDWQRTAESDMNIFTRILSATWEGLKGVFVGFFGTIGDLLQDGMKWILDKIGLGSVTDRINELMPGGISGMIASIFDWVRKLFSSPIEALKDIFTQFIPWMGQFAQTMFMNLADMVKWGLKGIWGGLTYVFTDVLPSLFAWLDETMTAFKESLFTYASETFDYLMGIPGRIGESFMGAYDAVIDWWENEPDKWGSMVDSATQLWEDIKNWVSNIFSDAWDALTDWWDDETDTAAMRDNPPETNDAVDTETRPPPPPPERPQTASRRTRNRPRPQLGTSGQEPEEPMSGLPPSDDIVALGEWLQGKGLHVSGHEAFGEVGTHGENSRHYRGDALDINFVGPNDERYVEADNPEQAAVFDVLRDKLETAGYSVMWRTGGHMDHMHVSKGTQEGTAEYRRERLASMNARGIPAPGSPQAPGTTSRTMAGTQLANAGNMGAGGGNPIIMQTNVGGSSSSTQVNNNSTQAAVIPSVWDVNAAFLTNNQAGALPIT
jgi:hypothetical protein